MINGPQKRRILNPLLKRDESKLSSWHLEILKGNFPRPSFTSLSPSLHSIPSHPPFIHFPLYLPSFISRSPSHPPFIFSSSPFINFLLPSSFSFPFNFPPFIFLSIRHLFLANPIFPRFPSITSFSLMETSIWHLEVEEYKKTWLILGQQREICKTSFKERKMPLGAEFYI